jgi:hypothetical protein
MGGNAYHNARGLASADEETRQRVSFEGGKKIISMAEWMDIANIHKAMTYGVEHQNTREALNYFPNSYKRFPLFPLGVEDERLWPAVKKWMQEYMELMKSTNNESYIHTLKQLEEESKQEDECVERMEAWDAELAKHGITEEMKSNPNNSERIWTIHQAYCARRRAEREGRRRGDNERSRKARRMGEGDSKKWNNSRNAVHSKQFRAYMVFV